MAVQIMNPASYQHDVMKNQFMNTANSVIAENIYRQLSNKSFSIVVPMIRIPDNTKSIRNTKPITIKIFIEEDIFFAENENLAICGTGESKQEAINDFVMHLIHFYEYYKTINDDILMGEAIRLKKLYNDLFLEESNAD